MTTFNDELLSAIDSRVTAAQERITAMGTVLSRDSFTAAMVQFDGSSVAVPVAVGADVEVYDGDRCGMVKFGAKWVVVIGFRRRNQIVQMHSLGYHLVWSSSNTSVTFVDIPDAQTFDFTKRFADTRVLVAVHWSAFAAGGTNTIGEWAVRVTHLVAGTVTDYAIRRFTFNTPSVHHSMSGLATITASQLEQGTEYRVKLAWRYVSGGGWVSMDTGDHVSFQLTETYDG